MGTDYQPAGRSWAVSCNREEKSFMSITCKLRQKSTRATRFAFGRSGNLTEHYLCMNAAFLSESIYKRYSKESCTACIQLIM